MSEATLQEIESRLSRAESRLRNTRRIYGSAIFLMVAAIAFLARTEFRQNSPEDIVRAREFILLDQGGTPRGSLSARSGETELIIEDRDGRIRGRLDPSQLRCAGVHIEDAGGNENLILGQDQDGAPVLVLKNPVYGAGYLRLGVRSPSGPEIAILDKELKTRCVIGTGTAGGAAIGLRDGKNGNRLSLVVDDQGDPSIALFDRDARPIWQAPK